MEKEVPEQIDRIRAGDFDNKGVNDGIKRGDMKEGSLSGAHNPNLDAYSDHRHPNADEEKPV